MTCLIETELIRLRADAMAERLVDGLEAAKAQCSMCGPLGQRALPGESKTREKGCEMARRFVALCRLPSASVGFRRLAARGRGAQFQIPNAQ